MEKDSNQWIEPPGLACSWAHPLFGDKSMDHPDSVLRVDRPDEGANPIGSDLWGCEVVTRDEVAHE